MADETTHAISSESISSDSISFDSFQEEDKQQTGLATRVVSGAYNKTATVVVAAKNMATPVIGGVAWITGTALSTSFSLVKSVGSCLVPARFRPAEPKDKAD